MKKLITDRRKNIQDDEDEGEWEELKTELLKLKPDTTLAKSRLEKIKQYCGNVPDEVNTSKKQSASSINS